MNDCYIFYHKSVLNTLDDDFHRFNELKGNAKKLELICEDGEKFVKGFIQIIGDIWFAFYKKDVQFKKEKTGISPHHTEFIEHLLALEDYKKWHIYTQSDDLLSVLTTITIGEQLLNFVKQDESVKKTFYKRKAAERKKEFAENKLEEIKMNLVNLNSLKFQQNANEMMLMTATVEIDKANEIGLQKIVAFKEQLMKIIQARSQIKHIQQSMLSLITINGRKIEHIALKEQLKLADAISKNKVIYEIAEMLGRFKKIVTKNIKTKQNQTMERNNIILGNEISRLLSSEIANYILPASRLDFLIRYSESLTFMYDIKAKEQWGKGPIIICIDESSSMLSMKAESKAFCFALLMFAQKQKRDFAIIPFSSDIGEVHYFYKGHTITDQIITFSEQFLEGSTNFEKPLREALSILLGNNFSNADIVFVTDGSSFLSNQYIEEFNKVKKQLKVECVSVVLTNDYTSIDLSVVHKFSNKVIVVKNLFEAEKVFSL